MIEGAGVAAAATAAAASLPLASLSFRFWTASLTRIWRHDALRPPEDNGAAGSDLTFFFSDREGEPKEGVRGLLDPSGLEVEESDFLEEEKKRFLNTIAGDRGWGAAEVSEGVASDWIGQEEKI